MDVNQGRVPPYSKEAEGAVLGSVLLNNKSLHLIQDKLSEDDFYVESHRRIYKSMQDLSSRGEPVDAVTLGHSLLKNGDLDKIGGPMALEGFTKSVSTTANVEHYAKIVAEKAMVRRMIYTAQQVAADGFGDIDDANEFVDNAEKLVFKAGQTRVGESYDHVSGVLRTTFENMETAAANSGEITGLTTGFKDLDGITAGLQATDLVIIAGRPAMGKTSFALNVAYNAAKASGLPAIVFSLEMSKEQLVRRMLSSEGRVDASRMRIPNRLDMDDWNRLHNAGSVLNNIPIYLDDAAPMTTVEIMSKARRLKADKGLGMIVIDYLQLMSGARSKGGNREQEISEISRTLKGLAKELDVPILALSQLNRSLESRPNKRPLMSDLRESGAIEQDADMIMFIYRDEVYNEDTEDKGVAEIIIGKQRSGPVGTVRLMFNSQFTKFDNLVHMPAAQEGNWNDGY